MHILPDRIHYLAPFFLPCASLIIQQENDFICIALILAVLRYPKSCEVVKVRARAAGASRSGCASPARIERAHENIAGPHVDEFARIGVSVM